jgi:hypothetical protein
MHTLFRRMLALAFALWLAACSSPPPAPADAVVIHYQHVANAHEVRFSTPLAFAPRSASYVLPRSRDGFWAIFVLCSLDVGARVPRFLYNVNNFRVDYAGIEYGPLHAFSLRFEDSAYLNGPADTPALAGAIAGELQRGPSLQVFSPGAYPAFDYRIALFVPRGLEGYAGDQLTLRYRSPSAILIGNGYPPFDIPVVGGSGTGVASHCLP